MPTNAPRRHFTTIDSTNAEALRQAEVGVDTPIWISASEQTKGRGRAGRSWASKTGNLMVTLLVDVAAPPQTAVQLGFVAALAVYECAAKCLGTATGLSLKWPNDVLMHHKKLAGLLLETAPTHLSSGGTRIAVGCGLNLVYAPEDTPYGATSIAEHCAGTTPTPDVALLELDRAFFKWLALWANGEGFGAIRDEWTKRAYPAGTTLTIDTGSGPERARFLELADDGALVVETANGDRKKFHAGDVRVMYDDEQNG